MHNGRSSGRLKCSGGTAELCRAAARVKIKIARKNVRRAKCERREHGKGEERSGVSACNLKASRCFSQGPKEAIRIPRATGGITIVTSTSRSSWSLE